MRQFFQAADMETVDTIRQAYRRLVMEFHPDKHASTEAEKWTALFKELQHEYDAILGTISDDDYEEAKTSYTMEKALQDMIDALMKISGIVVDLCGCWLWITGETFNAKDALKDLGFKWSKSKKSWYWGLTMTTKGKFRAKHKKMQDIYDAYGRTVFAAEETGLLG